MFIAVEGPNGVGKTTTPTLLAARLRERNERPVHLTTEPFNTPLGRLLRSSEAVLNGRALALAIADDRYAHLDSEVIPLLDAGHHVVSDRYVPSSLVLQRVDGMSLTEIWRYNAYALPPTVSFYLEDQPDVIRERLASRGELSRLEMTGSPGRELMLYNEAYRSIARTVSGSPVSGVGLGAASSLGARTAKISHVSSDRIYRPDAVRFTRRAQQRSFDGARLRWSRARRRRPARSGRGRA